MTAVVRVTMKRDNVITRLYANQVDDLVDSIRALAELGYIIYRVQWGNHVDV